MEIEQQIGIAARNLVGASLGLTNDEIHVAIVALAVAMVTLAKEHDVTRQDLIDGIDLAIERVSIS